MYTNKRQLIQQHGQLMTHCIGVWDKPFPRTHVINTAANINTLVHNIATNNA